MNTAVARDPSEVHEDVIARIKTIFDPEIPVDIWELGLIYGVSISDGFVDVQMTLTSPSCPEAQTLPPSVEAEIRSVDGISGCTVNIIWDPPWGPDRMSEEARLHLGVD